MKVNGRPLDLVEPEMLRSKVTVLLQIVNNLLLQNVSKHAFDKNDSRSKK